MAVNSDETKPSKTAKQNVAGQPLKDIQKTTRFRKDFKRMTSRGYDMDLLREVIDVLRKGKMLDEKYLNHQLEGRWMESYDCHLLPDCVLIYRTTKDSVILQAMGTHSDLFKK